MLGLVDKGSQRDHVARGIAGLEPDDILGLQPEIRFGLGRNGIGAAKGVEVIDPGVEGSLSTPAWCQRGPAPTRLAISLSLTVHFSIDLRNIHLIAGEKALQGGGLVALRE